MGKMIKKSTFNVISDNKTFILHINNYNNNVCFELIRITPFIRKYKISKKDIMNNCICRKNIVLLHTNCRNNKIILKNKEELMETYKMQQPKLDTIKEMMINEPTAHFMSDSFSKLDGRMDDSFAFDFQLQDNLINNLIDYSI